MRPIAAETPTAEAVPQQAALPKQQTENKVGPTSQTKDEPAVPQVQGKSLEELEDQSYRKLSKMKRPAGKLELEKQPEKKAKKGPNTKEKPKKSSAAVTKTLGCPRCRGSANGCSLCQDPCYKGVRTPGKQAWKDYMAKREKEKAKLKTKKK